MCDVLVYISVVCADMPAPTMAADVLQFWSTWLHMGVLLGLSVQRSSRLLWGGVYSTSEGWGNVNWSAAF